MRTTGKAVVVAVAALGLALTGCTGDSKTGSSPGAASSGASSGPGASGAPAPSGSVDAVPDVNATGAAASCAVGTWKSTALKGTLDAGGATGTLAGGGGFTMTVAADGKTAITFDGMQPVTFTFNVAGGEATGAFMYGGKVSGTVKMTGTTSGAWEPVGASDFSTLTVTLDMTKPVAIRVADKLPIAEFAGTGTVETNNAVDAQPILKRSTFKCEGNTLTLGPPAGTPATATWTLQKA
jgi:hypothetical protein